MSHVRPRATRERASGAAGLTLVEVLVVMFILALLAQAAVLATEGVADQAMRDVTERSLTDMEVALLGHPGRADAQGRTSITGFVADVGRLPRARIGTEPAATLRELWERRDEAPVPPGERIPVLQIAPAPGDAEVQLACGWRGPYLRLGLGRSAPFDGWGRPFRLWTDAGAPALEGELVSGIESFGADGVDDTGNVPPGFDADLGVTVHRTVPPLVQPRHAGTVRVQVRNLDLAQRRFVVRVYGPRDGAPRTLAQVALTVSGADEGGEGEATLPDIPIGPRVVRVYVYDSEDPPGAEDPLAVPGLDLPRSRIWNVTVESGIGAPLVVEMP